MRIIVTSPMRVGSTWLFFILQDFTGLPKNDLIDRPGNDGIKGNIRTIPDNTITKVHNRTPSEILNVFPNAKIFCITRNIYDAIVSLYFFLKHDPEVRIRRHSYSRFKPTESIDKWIRKYKFKYLMDDYKKYKDIQKDSNIFTTTFREMKKNLREVILDICDFLKINPHNIDNIIKKNSFKYQTRGRKPGNEKESDFRRKGVVGDYKNHLTEKDIKYIKELYNENS